MPPRKLTRRAALVGGVGLTGLLASSGLNVVDFSAANAGMGPQNAPEQTAQSTPDAGGQASDSPTESEPSGGTLEQLHDPSDWTGWENWGGTASVDEGIGFDGDRSLRVTAEEGDSRAAAVFRFATPQDLSRRFPEVGIRWKGAEPHNKTAIGLRLLDAEGRKAIYSSFPPVYFKREEMWQRLPLTVRSGATDAQFDMSAVASVGVYHYTDGEYPATFWIGDFRFAESTRERGAAMIHFDDESGTVYDTAFPIMEDHGIKGTFNIIARFIGTEGSPTVDELKEMRDAGWSITAHPQHPDPVPAMDEAKIREVFESEVAFLEEHDFTPSAMAWPYGRWDATSVSIAEEYFDICFAGGSGPHAAPPSPGSRMLLPRVGTDDVDKHPAAVDQAAERNGLVGLTFHTVGPNSTPKEEFAKVVEHVASSPVDALTADDLLGEMRG